MQQRLNSAKQALMLEGQSDVALGYLLPMLEERQNLSPDYLMAVMQMLGLASENKRQYDDATRYFLEAKDFYQAGYSQMLKGDIEQAIEHWKNLYEIRQNHWAGALLGMVTVRLTALPTFLQIRNHLEADIFHLIRAGQTQFLQNMLMYIDFLAEINYEAFKFAGRGLLNAGQAEQSGPYLLKGQKVLPNDPEIYYHLGQYYHAMGQFDESTLMLKQCILISPYYVPARDLLGRMKEAS